MKNKKGRERPSENEKVPLEVEGPSTAPEPDENEISSVAGHDSDRAVHHSVILEFDVPSYRTGAAQQRRQAKEVNRQN